MIVSGAEFAATLESRGFDFFSGVPCSLIEGLIATLEVHPQGDRRGGGGAPHPVHAAPAAGPFSGERGRARTTSMGEREWILLNPGPANTTPTVRGALGDAGSLPS